MRGADQPHLHVRHLLIGQVRPEAQKEHLPLDTRA
jgi:hypothetical protein